MPLVGPIRHYFVTLSGPCGGADSRCRQGGSVPYRVLNGLSYPPGKRAEVGDIVDDLPSKSIKWLMNKGHIEEVKGSAPRSAAVKPAVPPAPIAPSEPEEDDE